MTSSSGGYVSFNLQEHQAEPFGECGPSFVVNTRSRQVFEEHLEKLEKIAQGLDRCHAVTGKVVPAVDDDEVVALIRNSAFDVLQKFRRSDSPSTWIAGNSLVIEGMCFTLTPNIAEQFEKLAIDIRQRLESPDHTRTSS